MKYYAVTEDPNELLHYGRLGMKWGKHIFGDKPKSSGYKRALGKLRASANKTKTAIQKSSTQRAVNKQNKQQGRYAKAVEKTQRKINMIEGLNDLNHLKDIERSANRAHKEEQRFIRSEAKMRKYNTRSERKAEKQALKYARNEKHMDKYLQQARHGKLKYGKLSDEQVREITDRLNMERSARMLGSAEKTWRQQKRDALRAGKLKGIEAGTAAAMTEVARAGAQYGIQHLMNRKKLDAMAKYNAKRQKEADRIKNRKTHKEVKEDIRDELYEEAIKEGEGMFARRALRVKTAGEKLKDIKTDRLEEDRKHKLLDEVKNDQDREYYKLVESNKYDPSDAKSMRQKYADEFGTDQARKAFGLGNRKFNHLSEEEKRNVVLKLNNSVTEGKEREALKKMNELMEAREENKRIDQANANLMKGYTDRLNAWYAKGADPATKPKKPRMITRKKEPEITYELYDQVTSMNNLPPLYGSQNNGGKKKKGQGNQNN